MRHQPERAIQRQCVTLLRSIGARPWVLGTTRPRGDYHGTCQTPGLPDVMAHLPHGTGMLFLECKAPKGRLRPEQAEFRDETVLLTEAGCKVYHVVGGLDALIATLIGLGLVRADGVPHYRTRQDGAGAANGEGAAGSDGASGVRGAQGARARAILDVAASRPFPRTT